MKVRSSLSVAFAFAATLAIGAEPKKTPKAPPFDVSKIRVEEPAKDVVKRTAIVDQPKRIVELPTKRIVKAADLGTANPQAVTPDNPRVSPGKVRWRKDYAEALAVSKKSGRPVLLFQLLGELDHKFT